MKSIKEQKAVIEPFRTGSGSDPVARRSNKHSRIKRTRSLPLAVPQSQERVMKYYGFSFRREAVWITMIPFALLLIGLLVALFVWFLR